MATWNEAKLIKSLFIIKSYDQKGKTELEGLESFEKSCVLNRPKSQLSSLIVLSSHI